MDTLLQIVYLVLPLDKLQQKMKITTDSLIPKERKSEQSNYWL